MTIMYSRLVDKPAVLYYQERRETNMCSIQYNKKNLITDAVNGRLVYMSTHYAIYTTSVHLSCASGETVEEVNNIIENIINNDTGNGKCAMPNMFHKTSMEMDGKSTGIVYLVTRGGFDLFSAVVFMQYETRKKYMEAFNTYEIIHCEKTMEMSRKIEEQSQLIESYGKMAKPGTKEFFAYAVMEADKAIKEYEGMVSEQSGIIREQQEKLKEAQYAVAYTESMRSCQNGMIMNELAKTITLALRKEGYEWAGFGGKTLFSYLRDNGYLIKRKGNDYNTPTQKSMNLGIFDVKYTPVCGETKFFRKATVKANPKGQEYFLAHFITMYRNGGYIGKAPGKHGACTNSNCTVAHGNMAVI